MEDEPVDVEDEEEEAADDAEVVKQASRGGTYSLCSRARLDGLAAKFGLTPEEFSENLRDNYQRHEVQQEPNDPDVAAQEFYSRYAVIIFIFTTFKFNALCFCSIFKTSEEVLMGAKYMVAIQLSREPLVRSTLREAYQEKAKLTVRPTKRGMKEIDENHPCYSIKYLKDKPVRDLSGDMFLKLHMAEQEKLLTLTLSEDIDGMTTCSYLEEIKNLYIKVILIVYYKFLYYN